jgi:hypothetical protein
MNRARKYGKMNWLGGIKNMEKIKSRPIIWLMATLTIGCVVAFLFLHLKLIDPYRALVVILTSPLFVLYIYFQENFLKDGFYFQEEGISFFKNNIQKTISWDDVRVQSSIVFGWKISLNNERKNISFDPIYRKSIIELARKYCPKDHELYKAVEEYSKNKNISF